MIGADSAIPELGRAGLRKFALSTGAVVLALFGVLLPWLLSARWPIWPWAVAGTLGIWGLIAPRSLRPVYRGWMRVGLVLNRVTTPIVLGVVFFGLFFPVALIMRAIGRDALSSRIDKGADTYRIASKARADDSFEKPY